MTPAITMCRFCGFRPLRTSGDYMTSTCTASECQQASFEAMTIWNGLSRNTKLALAERSAYMLDRVFGVGRESVARVVIDVVLARCDKYRRDMVRR